MLQQKEKSSAVSFCYLLPPSPLLLDVSILGQLILLPSLLDFHAMKQSTY
jgi:hypothetical protein